MHWPLPESPGFGIVVVGTVPVDPPPSAPVVTDVSGKATKSHDYFW